MTRLEAIQEFKETAKYLHDRGTVGIRCAFVDFIDALARSNRITEKQAETWNGLQPKEIKSVQKESETAAA